MVQSLVIASVPFQIPNIQNLISKSVFRSVFQMVTRLQNYHPLSPLDLGWPRRHSLHYGVSSKFFSSSSHGYCNIFFFYWLHLYYYCVWWSSLLLLLYLLLSLPLSTPSLHQYHNHHLFLLLLFILTTTTIIIIITVIIPYNYLREIWCLLTYAVRLTLKMPINYLLTYSLSYKKVVILLTKHNNHSLTWT